MRSFHFVRRLARSTVTSAAIVILSFAASASAAGLLQDTICPTCQLAARMQQQRQQMGSSLSPGASNLGLNVASILHHPSLVSVTSPSQQDTPNWDGQGDLPGAFHAPWGFADTNFDPSFRTPYWSDATGPINDPSAPWNQYLPASYASAYFAIGRQQALGLVPFAPALVWAPAPTPPQATSGGASLSPIRPI